MAANINMYGKCHDPATSSGGMHPKSGDTMGKAEAGTGVGAGGAGTSGTGASHTTPRVAAAISVCTLKA